MTEKRIREIAVKLQMAYAQGVKKALPRHWIHRRLPFAQIPRFAQAGWISAARIAVNEVQGAEATKLLKSANKMVRGWHEKLDRSTKACRIGPGGKRACK